MVQFFHLKFKITYLNFPTNCLLHFDGNKKKKKQNDGTRLSMTLLVVRDTYTYLYLPTRRDKKKVKCYINCFIKQIRKLLTILVHRLSCNR